MQGEKLNIIKSDFQDLQKIVEERMGVSLLNKKRLMILVDARMIFSKILRDRGYTLSSIARFLKKDHTTIMNYMDKIVYLLNQDDKLFDDYMVCKDMFLKSRKEIIEEIDDKDMHMKMARVSKKLDDLIREREYILGIDSKNKRFRYIIDMLNKVIPEGREAYFENKIMKLLNE